MGIKLVATTILLLALSGCARFIHPEEINAIQEGCADRGGIDYISITNTRIFGVCNDGVTTIRIFR